ncbi:MAG: hypothetical protein M3680_25665 [Myxococcota bacterium]|nr:hypothetical protein [Myxococcota bacterium]
MTRPQAPDVAPLLVAATSAIEQGRWEAAAARCVEAWLGCRTERIARALAAVETRLPAPPPLEGDTVTRREQHWHELASRGDDASLRRVFAAPWPAHPQQAFKRLETLAPFASARISMALLALHRRRHYPSVAGCRLSRLIFNHLIDQDDHAATEELERLAQNPAELTRLGPAVFRRRRPLPPLLTPAA